MSECLKEAINGALCCVPFTPSAYPEQTVARKHINCAELTSVFDEYIKICSGEEFLRNFYGRSHFYPRTVQNI